MSINPISALSDNIRVDRTKCIGCGDCVERCTLDNLRLLQAPCAHACPLGIDAQGYVQLIKRGALDKAIAQVYRKTPFLGFLGNICNHPCERECSRNKVDGTGVSIRALKRYLYEHAPVGPDMTIENRVHGRCAIVGGGPAGMAAAWYLAKAGCAVTIFEAGEDLGGTLSRAVPRFRLPDEVVSRECSLVKGLGVEVRTGVRVGQDIPFQELIDGYDAVFLATGTTEPVRIPQAPEGTADVEYAVDFLTRARKNPNKLTVKKEVLVIGGGDVAIDAAQTARRAGADQVTVMSLEPWGSLPASPDSIREAEAEQVRFLPGWGLGSITTRNGKVTGISAKQCVKLFDDMGRFAPVYDESITQEISAQQVILAIGQRTDLSYLDGSEVEVERGRIKVHPITMQTSVAHVFAGGDSVPGPNTAVHALADGARAAESMLLYLNGDDVSYGRDNSMAYIHDFEVDLTTGSAAERVDLSAPGTQRIERSMTDEEAMEEAGRCLSCGHPVGERRTCWMCMPCEVQCEQQALEVGIHYSMA